MAIPREEYERITAERIEAEEASRREVRRHWIITLLVCMLWCAFGAFITGLGFALVLDRETADVLIYLRHERGLE
jgi:hypothetical protein